MLARAPLEQRRRRSERYQSGKCGRVYTLIRGKKKSSATLQEMLAAEPWDVVTLQQLAA
ncbi:hypothetical protein [Blastopirellula retiformator]|uniref:Uncharacterized protein n=1 Tax=Blastopirellula retiformator TaxID=2527970 RepID=A0A5C5V8L6_9BACT|nr:hypothetical protein [Blastopirellula retiformator]TWT34350.1 hypothetical protein Enr8_17440 [Blastopirellula retiformator]